MAIVQKLQCTRRFLLLLKADISKQNVGFVPSGFFEISQYVIPSANTTVAVPRIDGGVILSKSKIITLRVSYCTNMV